MGSIKIYFYFHFSQLIFQFLVVWNIIIKNSFTLFHRLQFTTTNKRCINQSNNFFGQHLFAQVTHLCNCFILNLVFQANKANRYYSTIICFEHLIGMLCGVLSGRTTWREIKSGLAVADVKRRYLGLDDLPLRGTLSDGHKKPALRWIQFSCCLFV